jgi:translocator protein
MQNRSWPALIGFILLVATVSALGGWITSTSVSTWFPALDKPSWNPPGWLFGPVWTVLYGMMAFVAWRLWRVRDSVPAARRVLAAWFIQLALNSAWSFLFFGLRSPAAGLADIIPLLVVITWILVSLGRIDRVLACLWTPYVLWVGFATALNLSIWLRQP